PASGDEVKALKISLSNVELGLGDGTTDFVRITDGGGSLVARGSEVYGRFTGLVAVDIPQVTLTDGAGNGIRFTVALNTGTADRTLDGVTIKPGLKLTANDAVLNVAGQQISGNFAIEQTKTPGPDGNLATPADNGKVVRIAITNLGLKLGTPASPFVNLQGASGFLLISDQGIAAKIDASLGPGTFNLPGIAVSATSLSIQINTSSSAVDETFVTGTDALGADVTQRVELAAGPFVRIEVLGGKLTVGGVDLAGSFAFDQKKREDGGSVTRIAVTGLAVTVGGQSLSNGEGAFAILPADPLVAGSGGIAGFASGQLVLGGGGVSGSASAGLRINKTGLEVHESIQVGEKTLTIDFGPGQGDVLEIFASDVNLTIADFLCIEGGSFSDQTVGNLRTIKGAANLFVGQGPATIKDSGGNWTNLVNPAARGILIENAVFEVKQFNDTTPATYAMGAKGTIHLLGIPGVTFSGTVVVEINTTGVPQAGTQLDGDGNLVLDLDATQVIRVRGDNLSLDAGGQTISGSFAFTQETLPSGERILTIDASDVLMAFGDGDRDAASPKRAPVILQGSGVLRVGSAGMAGIIDATANVNFPGFGAAVGITVKVNTAATAADVVYNSQTVTLPAGPYVRAEVKGATPGQPAELTILGQTLKGSFVFEQLTALSAANTAAPKVVRIAMSDVSLDFRAGSDIAAPTIVMLREGSGFLMLSPTGMAGRVDGTVTIDLSGLGVSGVEFDGTFGLAINTGSTSVDQQITINDQTINLSLPAGPFLRIEGTGVKLWLFGQRISGDFAFEQITDAAGQ
ncbi:MAG: hypothetical protein NTU94_07360, partial [Planctomycetota bacterium]|nr:hypothetical protein [Planctomycetota bacterium]